MNIILIGYRCTGKTTVGRALAKNLGWKFVDTDVEVVKTFGASIEEIVEKEGWLQFRSREKAIVERMSLENRHVISTGGGVVIDPENVENLKKNGLVIWLKASVQTILNRMERDFKSKDMRPALTSLDMENEIRNTLALRDSLYRDAMDFSLHTDSLGANDICEIIYSKILQMKNDVFFYDSGLLKYINKGVNRFYG